MTMQQLRQEIEPVNEEWRAVVGWEGLYEVSDLGRVKSLARYVPHGERRMFVRERILKPQVHNSLDGRVVGLSRKDAQPRMYLVHILVAQAFLPNPDNLPEVNHIDFDRTNNRLSNLEWCTKIYNLHYSMFAGRKAKKLSDAAIFEIQRRLAKGESQQSIGDAFGVSQAHISRIKLGLTWERHTKRLEAKT